MLVMAGLRTHDVYGTQPFQIDWNHPLEDRDKDKKKKIPKKKVATECPRMVKAWLRNL